MKGSGPRARALARRLALHESRNVTHTAGNPIFWESARGAIVTDVDGNEYIDCTAAFGVANAGHANPHVVDAIAMQARRLVHGMGDVHPTEIRVRLLERLKTLLPKELDTVYIGTTGSDAVETALKTAILRTGKARFAAFRNGYHGLSFGALNVAGIQRFREPFLKALAREPVLLPFPEQGIDDARAAIEAAERALAGCDDLAALVVEPIQGRGGAVVPPEGYLGALRELCVRRGLLFVVDEIYTGFGRTGTMFAFEREGIVPDLLCIGKALGNGFPISATIGRADVMAAWPASSGEALHTSTFLGHPIGCAAALATLDEFERLRLVSRAQRLGSEIASRVQTWPRSSRVVRVRGRGMLFGIVCDAASTASAIVNRALAAGTIVLQSGSDGSVMTLAPPLTIEDDQLDAALRTIEVAVSEAA
jgi:4-aminobutyrate aminotransferase/(S)-3-amino-2-methylpropionate transaminase